MSNAFMQDAGAASPEPEGQSSVPDGSNVVQVLRGWSLPADAHGGVRVVRHRFSW